MRLIALRGLVVALFCSVFMTGCQLGYGLMIEREVGRVDGQYSAHGVHVTSRRVRSFSFLPGRELSIDQADLRPPETFSNITLQIHSDAAPEGLDLAIISEATTWTCGLFENCAPVDIAIQVLPAGVRAKSISTFKRDEHKLMFVFADTNDTEYVLRTLAHELSHYCVKLSERDAPNRLSDEVTAKFVELSAVYLAGYELPESASPVENVGLPADIFSYSHERLMKLISKGSETTQSYVVSDVIYRRLMDASPDGASLVQYTTEAVKRRHDYRTSFGL